MQDNNDMMLILSKAEELITQDKFHEAIKILENNLDSFANEVMFLNFLIRLYLFVDDSQSAFNYLMRALEIEQENLTTLELGGEVFHVLRDFKQAEIAWKKIVEIDVKRYKIWKKLGKLYYEIGEYHEAVQAFSNYLEYEENIEIYSLLSTIYKKMGNEIESWNNLMKAEKLDPENETVLLQIGETYLDLDNYDRAIDYFQKTTNNNPENISAWFQLGRSYEANNESVEAIEAFSNVIELDPDNVLAFFHLAKTYAALAKIEEASRYYEECLSRDPSFLEATLALASLSWVAKDNSKAIAYLEDSLRYNVDNYRLLQMLGDIYEDLGDDMKAAEYWAKASELEE